MRVAPQLIFLADAVKLMNKLLLQLLTTRHYLTFLGKLDIFIGAPPYSSRRSVFKGSPFSQETNNLHLLKDCLEQEENYNRLIIRASILCKLPKYVEREKSCCLSTPSPLGE